MGEGISDKVKDAPEQSYRLLEKREDYHRRPPEQVRQMPRQMEYNIRNR